LTVEGDGIAFARLVADRYGAGIALFERFATARLILPNGLKIDIASARRETYANPAALPDVLTASLEEDLFRRDFTINAMAIQLNRAHWAHLHDPYGGQRDLNDKRLRVLHERSFVDDPTRIFRAIRFAQRFVFRLEPNTERLLVRAANTNLVARLSGPRLANEIFALMKEDRPDLAIERLRRLRLLRFLHPRLRMEKLTKRLLAALPLAIDWWDRHCAKSSLDRPLLWVMALLAQAPRAVIAGTIQRLQLSGAQTRALEWAGEKTSRISKTLSTEAPLRPSHVYRLLSTLPEEALTLVLAKGHMVEREAGVGRLKRRLLGFLTRDRHVTITINGETLKQFGLRPGPHFKTILDRLLDERLDGRLTAGAQERDRARILVQQYGYSRYLRRR
jgi:tRNA nucleotidyltransferase (CCA-adding enzyme)